jgi:hypothetical protein
MPAERSEVGVFGCEMRVCQVRVPFAGVGKDSGRVAFVYVEGMMVALVFVFRLAFEFEDWEGMLVR